MTVESQGNKKSWIGDGSTTVYAYPYPFQKTEDIEIYFDGVKQTSGYSIQILPDYSEGANITFLEAPADGVEIVVRRSIAMTQEVSYPENGEFPAKSHERALDKLTLILLDKLTETVKVDPSTAETFSLYLPRIIAKKGLKINDDGTGFALTDADIDDILSDPGFIQVSQDLLLGENSKIRIDANNKNNIDTVANSIPNVNITAGSINNVNTTGQNIIPITAVAGDLIGPNNIGTVATDLLGDDDIGTVARSIQEVNATGQHINEVITVAMDIDGDNNTKTVADNITDVNICANSIEDIKDAEENAQFALSNAVLSQRYAIGVPTEPLEGSAKYWAEQAAKGQIQSDWGQEDTSKKDYIKNKPVIYTQTETNNLLNSKADANNVYTKTESDNRYVNVSGDTMTGSLNFTLNGNLKPIVINMDNVIGSWGENLSDIDFRVGGQRKCMIRCNHATSGNNNLEFVIYDNAGNIKDTFSMTYDATSNKVTYRRPQLITTYVSGTSGYNIWSNGYCEQWGYSFVPSDSLLVNLLKTFRDTNYIILAASANNNMVCNVDYNNQKTTTSFRIDYPSGSTGYCYWKVLGYLANGQY